jgi:short-subunit dehydrogenase
MSAFRDRYGGAALVTGASAGIGRAFASALAARGMDVVLVARRKDRLEAIASDIGKDRSIATHVIECDLADRSSIARLAAEVEGRGLEIGLLVNNAGFGTYGSFTGEDLETSIRMVDVNCRAPLELAHRFLPGMLARGRGGIVFVASTAAYQPAPFLATYGATKAFDLMLAEALWAELGPKGIHVLGLSPGFTPTEFQEVAGTHEFRPPGGSTSPEEVVETALRSLGYAPSVIPGFMNNLFAFSVRFSPRAWVAKAAARVGAPKGTRDG